MAKKKTTTKKKTAEAKAPVETKEEAVPVKEDEPVVEETLKVNKNKMQILIKKIADAKYDGDEKLAARRIRYITGINPPPENEEEVEFLVDRFLAGKPLTINRDRNTGSVFDKRV